MVFLTGSSPEEAVFGASGVCSGKGGPWKTAHPGKPGSGVAGVCEHVCTFVPGGGGWRRRERWGACLEEVLYPNESHMPL